MPILEVVVAGVFGLIVGSFINVCVLRHNTGRSILGRSGCMSCGETLPPQTLVPVLSWVFLGGRCHACGARISVQYPLVEIATGISFAVVALAGQNVFAEALLFILAATLIAIAAYDVRHTIVPDSWVYGAMACALLYRLVTMPVYAFADVLWVLAGAAVAAPLYALWVLTRGRGIGFGDVKLGVVAGLLLGSVNGLLALAFAFVLGAALSVFVLLPLPYYRSALTYCGIPLWVPHAGFTMKSEIPFGPFIIAGIFILWFVTTFYGNDYTVSLLGFA